MSERAKFTPTEEQQAVVEAVSGRESVMVSAYAGCAKTSTLELAAGQVRVPALALAFNKKIASEMAGRMPGNFKVQTMNGLGFGAWLRANSGVQAKIDPQKLGKLVTQVAKDRRVQLSSDQWDGLRQLVSGAMLAGIVPAGAGPEGFLPDDRASWKDGVADGLGMFDDDFDLVYDLAREVLEQDIALAKQGVMSFDDQVYCSTMLGGRFPLYPVVFVDEAQDLSPLNHAMLAKCVRPDGRLVAVGDEKQAIYAFRGASGDSMTRIRALRPQWVHRPLATTFRCPKAIVARQQAHAPGFRAWHTNAEGRVASLAAAAAEPETYLHPEKHIGWGWQDLQEARGPDGDAVSLAILCRNNGPLMSMAFKLLRRGIGVVMLGRDIGKGLTALARKLASDDTMPIDQVMGKLLDWETGETSLALANGREEKVAGIIDRAECLRAVAGAGARDAGELRGLLTKLFAREEGQVTLGSIHRAKGLEWDVVLHLDPWRIPSKWAREAAKAGDPVQLGQEFNLRYVCETRTRHTLLQASLEDFR